MPTPHRTTAIVLSVLALLVAGCASSPGPGRADDAGSVAAPAVSVAPGGGPTYVALGDSYVAGPGLGEADSSSGVCQRSTTNYPSLLADRIGADLVDASCSGATTRNLLGVGGGVQPPQLGAVGPGTELVTVGVGANDADVFVDLVSSCISAFGGTAGTCRALATDLPARLTRVEGNVVETLRAVRSAAPGAQVLLVGYPRIAPDASTCEELGIPAEALEMVRGGEQRLEGALAAAARAAGVRFVSLADVSRGHDVCAGPAAWVNGLRPATGEGAMLHPRPAGMRAVADAVAKALGTA